MKTFTIVVSSVSNFDIQAENKAEAEKKANRLLSKGDANTFATIDEYSTAWEITNVEDPSE